MKKLIVKTLAVLLLVLLVPAGALTAALAIPAQYSETYYGELPEMYDRLKGTQGKKIVLVGCSGLVFGVNGALLEQEFPGYTVCPFALYGSVGTKAMMELSRPYISEGDIVILAPEIGPQTLSLYFNGENMWLASDGRADILRDLPAEEAANMA
ncbi:MAG: hypothetical protein ILP12_02495, partial [Lachnospiraceae bacterium]|nr:hypothetical protein [Lachnospiraceae bacterium]